MKSSDFLYLWSGRYRFLARDACSHAHRALRELELWDLALSIIKATLQVDDDGIRDLGNKITEASGAKIPYEFLPLQDCVDLSILLIRTTAQLMEYQTQARTVGGAIDVATITRQEGFRYVQCKRIRGERPNDFVYQG